MTTNDVMRIFFEQTELCEGTDFCLKEEDRAKLNLMATGMRIMARAIMDELTEEERENETF